MVINFREKANFIWSVADILRHDYKQSDYGNVILPLTVLRRLDCVMEPTKEKVLDYLPKTKGMGSEAAELLLKKQAKLPFYNKSKYDFKKLVEDPDHLASNLRNFISGFSKNARDIIQYFAFDENIEKMDKGNILFLVIKKFSEIDLHPDQVANIEMGYIFEELIRKFADASNETAGEHFTPREVIRLMVDILFTPDSDILTKKEIVKTVYDPACGTGGMLSVAEEYMRELNKDAHLVLFGQEINDQTYAICNSDMLIKGENPDNIKYGNSFTHDGLKEEKFDYMLSNPPFGVEWKKFEDHVVKEHEQLGFSGRFGAGLPRISDGSFLFLQHMISKMKPENVGSKIAIVFNGSPLFSGGAGSGESEIRKWIIENDWLETIIALPDQLFYNTGISTYIWIVTNRKQTKRKGKIQLVNATNFFAKMARSLGNKRNEITQENIEKIVKIYGDFKNGEYCKIFDNKYFGYTKVTVERPLRLNFLVNKERILILEEESAFLNLAKSKKKGAEGLKEIEAGQKLQEKIKSVLMKNISGEKVINRETFQKWLEKLFEKHKIEAKKPVFEVVLYALSERDETADICLDVKGKPEPDADLRDYENVSLGEDIDKYFEKEVKPHVPDAWMDRSKDKIGYELNFTKEFYKYKPLRSLEDIRKDILALEKETEGILKEILE